MATLSVRAIDPLEDGISSVALTAHMGDDLMVVNCARVSYDKESDWEEETFYVLGGGSKTLQHLKEADTRIIRYMAKHNHWTPFGHPQLQFRIKMPIFIAREWYRHVVGVVRNEVSRRYVSSEPEIYIPKQLRQPDPKNKQASQGIHPYSDSYIQAMRNTSVLATSLYNEMIAQGVAAEQARTVLSQSMYTEFIETGSLYFYHHLCGLRIAEGVQPETRAYAEAVDKLIEPLFPISWKELQNARTNE